MSKQELVAAYLSRQMDRRVFIKRLVSLGVSIGAAGAYAQILTENASAAELDPVYGARPVIVPLSPEPRSTISDRSPVVKARVRDRETNLRKSNVSVSFDGEFTRDFEYDPSRNLLTYRPGRLPDGRHKVKVYARDGLGGTRNRGWVFFINSSGGK